MTDKHQFLRIAGIVFGLVIPFLFTFIYLAIGIVSFLALLSALLSGKATFILAGPIIFAIVCLVKLKWKIRKSRDSSLGSE
jgi:hypothetical protein